MNQNIPKASCMLCKCELACNMLDRHYNTKVCKNNTKSHIKGECKYCKLVFTQDINAGAHVKWCNKNPTRGSGVLGNPLFGSINQSEESKLRMVTGVSNAHKRGAYKNAPVKALATRITNGNLLMSDQAKVNISIAARKSKHQRVCKKTHEFIDKRGRTFNFDSSWEDACAIRLDELDLNWTRPEPIKYIDLSGKQRHYFPDFYLVDFDIYLDPKNTYVEKLQKEKLDIISKMIDLRILRTLKECKEFSVVTLSS